MQLLVVDDEADFRQHLRRVFTDAGYKVVTAASGKEAIVVLESLSPDIVITDIVMPHGDGFSILKHVQEHDLRCPVIVITAYASQESAVRALRLGAYDYVTKPFDLDVILAAAKRAADHCRLQQAVSKGRKELADLAIANARLYAEAERDWREQRYLQEIAHAFNSTLDLEQVLELVMAKTNELLGVEAGSVALLSQDRQELVFHASVGGGAAVVKGLRMSASQGIVGWVVSHEESLLVPDITQDARHYRQVDTRSGFKTRSILCVPLVVKGTVIGAIEVLNKIGGSFDADDQRMAEALAISAATAIENARLFQREKRALEKLRQAQDELVHAQRLAVLGQIGVTVRHEVNNPLTVVLGNVDWLLQEPTDLTGEPLRALEAIRANALRIRDIVKKLEEIQTDRVTEYVTGVEMIDIHNQDV